MTTLQFSPYQRFLLWAAGFDFKTASNCETAELNKMCMYGTLVLVPPIIALFSYGYFIHNLSDNWWATILGAIAISYLLLTIERSIMGIGKPSELNIGLFVRFLIAVGMSFLISEPIIFYFYKDDVKEMLFDEKKAKEDLVDARYTNELERLRTETKNSADQLESLRKDYTVEGDGSGGTGDKGQGNNYITKKADHDKYELTHNALINKNDSIIKTIEAKIVTEKSDAVAQISKSPFKQMRLLHQLSKTDDSVFYVTWFFRLLFLLIEILPMAMKVSMRKMFYHTYEEELANLKLKFFQGQQDERLEFLLRKQQNEYARERNTIKIEKMNIDARQLNKELDLKAKLLQEGLKAEANLHKTNCKLNGDDKQVHKKNSNKIELLINDIIDFVSGSKKKFNNI